MYASFCCTCTALAFEVRVSTLRAARAVKTALPRARGRAAARAPARRRRASRFFSPCHVHLERASSARGFFAVVVAGVLLGGGGGRRLDLGLGLLLRARLPRLCPSGCARRSA